MTRRFRPFQESIDICTKMLVVAAYYPTEEITNPDGTKMTVVDYWIHRRNGYAKLANMKGIPVQVAKVEEY